MRFSVFKHIILYFCTWFLRLVVKQDLTSCIKTCYVSPGGIHRRAGFEEGASIADHNAKEFTETRSDIELMTSSSQSAL